MGKTKIEWCDWTLNPITGKCPHGCEYCYMNEMRERFPNIHKEQIEFKPEVIDDMLRMRTPKTIFWGSGFDLFVGDSPFNLLSKLYDACASEKGEKHNHVFLTKNPKNYWYKDFQSRSNIFLGASTTGNIRKLCVQSPGTEPLDFISVEPFIEWDAYNYNADIEIMTAASFTHLIIGDLTGKKKKQYRPVSYVGLNCLVSAAIKAKKKIFIKNSLKKYIPLLCKNTGRRVEDFRQLPWTLHTKSLTKGVSDGIS